MATSIANFNSFVETVTGTTHNLSLTVSAGTARKVVVCVTDEAGIASLAVTFDGNAMTLIASASHTVTTQLSQNWYYYDLSDGYGTGSKTISFTHTTSTSAVTVTAWQLAGAATGAPEYGTIVESAATSTSSTTNSSVAVTANAAILATGNTASATPTLSSWTGVTGRQENNETNYTSAYADAVDVTAGTKTVTVTWSSTSGDKLLGVVSVAEAAPSGLTITSVTPSSFDSGIAGIVIAGAGFGASQGSSTVDIGGQAQTVTAWSDTSITFTSARGSNSMGAAALKLTRG